jgi:site-specific recombinase XerD
MSRKFVYKSVLASFMDGFVAMKEACGVDCLRTKWILLEIDNFFCQKDVCEVIITKELILQWQQTRVNDCARTLHEKISVISQLARYMSRHGYDCYIPQLPKKSAGKTDFIPYIFSFEQMAMLFDKSNQLKVYDAHMNSTVFCIPAILRLLYSTGLRISEALSIRNRDVYFERKYIHIRKTKNGTERIVPINGELEKVLMKYISYRNRMPIKSVNSPDAFLFIKPDGTYCNAQSVYKWFRRLLSACNIPYTGNHHGPRVHDLRHTFAVHSLVQMARNGQDIYNCLPVISTCLGHKSLSATEQYVRLIEGMYPELVNQCSSVSAYVFPKVIS